MGKVFTHMTMSLDGFVADPNDHVGELFDWYEAGEVTVPNPNETVSFQVDDASAQALQELTGNCGALVAGRRLFDSYSSIATSDCQAPRWSAVLCRNGLKGPLAVLVSGGARCGSRGG